MDHDELGAWLRLTLTPGVGNGAARRLLARFGLPQSIFQQTEAALQHCVPAAQARALCEIPLEWEALWQATAQWLAGAAPQGPARAIVSLGDLRYPQALLDTEDPPLLLYLMGPASLLAHQPFPSDRCLAVVGSRNPTAQGAENARLFARALHSAGLTIVSGLALGVDAAAHEGALDAATTPCAAAATIAVVGTGLDRVYPRKNLDLAHRIAAQGLIVSEYPLGTPPLPANFPKRNRIISGLCQGTLVVEAALASGSLITARMAAEQGREVFAIPGSIHAPQSRGCHALIRQGAKLVESAQDVLEELKIPATTVPGLPQEGPDAAVSAVPGKAEGPVLLALGYDPMGLDALVARTGMDASALQVALLDLELDGSVARLPGGLFQRVGKG
jgi:DNA processing protein